MPGPHSPTTHSSIWKHVTRGFPGGAQRKREGKEFCRADLTGRMSEFSGYGAGAEMTLAFVMVRDVQIRQELAAWISPERYTFFPPDAAEMGVDLSALPVIRVKNALDVGYAAERLLRSGAFALLVLDLCEQSTMPRSLHSRLAGLARKHDTALLCLTHKRAEEASLGPMVSLRCMAERISGDIESPEKLFNCRLHVIKDRRGYLHRYHDFRCRSLPGLERI